MLKSFLKDYFSFTKKERTAVLLLVFLITIIFFLPQIIPDNDPVIDKAALQTFEHQLAKLKTVHADTAGYHVNDENAYSGNESRAGHLNTGTLFYFDPNTLSFAGWQKLGIREKTIKTIQNYLSKGGRFRHGKDIEKIYGMRNDDVQRLLPYIQIKEANVFPGYRKDYAPSTNTLPQTIKYLEATRMGSLTLDINTADTSAWIALPGIGSKLASRIIHFREKLGGFYSVDQLSEVYGLADSIILRIKPGLKISTENIETIPVNTASENELNQHPYFRQNIGKAVAAYRLQHGVYTSKEDLMKIDIVTPEVFEKIAPYVSLN